MSLAAILLLGAGLASAVSDRGRPRSRHSPLRVLLSFQAVRFSTYPDVALLFNRPSPPPSFERS
jgi:hypothetical protein